MFGRKQKPPEENPEPETIADDLLGDLPRGVLDRKKLDSWMPRQYFAKPDEVAGLAFEDHSDHIFIGSIGGKTELETLPNGRKEYVTKGGQLIGIRDDRHVLTVAGSRAGKGRSAIVPNLLSYGGSVVVIDPKGENASLTALYREEKLGQQVYILDPFEITHPKLKKYRKCYNPLTTLSLASKTIIEDAGRIADSIVVPSPDSKDPHWDYSAKALIESLILHVVCFEKFNIEERTLVKVADLLYGRGDSFSTTLSNMMTNVNLNGHIAAAARSFADIPDEERGSVLSTARRHMKFLDYLSIQSVLGDHEFSLEKLKSDKVSIYVCLPSTRMGSCRSFLRMMVTLTLGTMDNVLEKPDIPVLVCMDEFPVLGYMKEIEDAAGQIAGFGVKLWPIIQDLGQLKSLYKFRWESFLGNTGIIQAFGNVDNFTLEYLSKKLGNTTIITSHRSAQTREQTIQDAASGISEQEKTTALLLAQEIGLYFAREDRYCRQLILLPGKYPIITSKVYYDQCEPFKSRYDQQSLK